MLQPVGRTPNGKKIAACKVGVAVTDRGFINGDIQMRTNVAHIFAIVGQSMLARKAVNEAHGRGKILGGGMAGTHAGDMIGEIALVVVRMCRRYGSNYR